MLTFIESKLFTSLIPKYLTDDGYSALQRELAARPDSGQVIPGSGGVRTLRWGAEGRGKRGGIRIIYYLRSSENELWMPTVYAKNEAASIPGNVSKKIKEQIDGSL